MRCTCSASVRSCSICSWKLRTSSRISFWPLGHQSGRLFPRAGYFFQYLPEPGRTVRISLLLQCLPLHLQLHHLTLELINFNWHGIQFDLETGSGLIDEIHRLVGQKSV